MSKLLLANSLTKCSISNSFVKMFNSRPTTELRTYNMPRKIHIDSFKLKQQFLMRILTSKFGILQGKGTQRTFWLKGRRGYHFSHGLGDYDMSANNYMLPGVPMV